MLKAAVLCFMVVLPLHAQTASPDQIRSAATRAVAAVQHGTTGFYKYMDCFSCHDAGLPMLAFRMARQRGVSVDEAAASQVAAKGLVSTTNIASLDRAVQDPMIIDPVPSDGWALIAAHAAGVEPNLVTAAYARRIATWQRPDGHWPTADVRPPQSYSVVTATALAVRVMQLYMPAELRQETDERTRRAKAWLLAAEPHSTEDATFRLFGLNWAGATEGERHSAARDLLALERADGGWSEIPHMQPEAYSTGEALVALHEAGGIPINDPAWQKGLAYLLSTQQNDGTWHVHTRMVSPAAVSPPYFETGFPYGHDQFLSTDGTCWAAMALMLALPKVATPSAPQPIAGLQPKWIEPWMKTALFGTAPELKALLDGRLDVNSKTPEGTTLLMMAAPDAEKVKLLIDRGADVRAQAKTGFTALMVATTYFGSSQSVKLLLDHGAEARQGKGVMFDASPLILAAFAGDRENIALLLAKGADPNRRMNLLGMFPTSALIGAVGFGDAAVVQALLKGGADVHEKDRDKMTPLHWAAVDHRAEVAKALVAAGADVNAVDRFGYTPLLYAATIDFGDADTATALLGAGADPNVKDKEGKTAWAQASEYPYIRAALEKAGGKE
ncbi:MAG TPA: ankyrin repeat domain-containing protein [Terriglobia bacterium]|nr:ankyrin repeat domain-containing protein [Terriglobia bacterium]